MIKFDNKTFDSTENVIAYICFKWNVQPFQVHISNNLVSLSNKLGETFAYIGEIKK